MTLKYLTGTYPNGYSLGSQYSGLVVEQQASVGGTGVVAPAAASITNLGAIQGSANGVCLRSGGSVINGSIGDETAMITGGNYGVAAYQSATISNFGTIRALDVGQVRPSAVFLNTGGSLTNGSATDTMALITGGDYAVLGWGNGGPSTIANFGTIENTGSTGGDYGNVIFLDAGGMVTNGSATDTTALISGKTGVLTSNITTVANYGTINGVELRDGGMVTNGSATDRTALINGGGVFGALAVTVSNFSTIQAEMSSDNGVYLRNGGLVTNGSASDTSALISGSSGVATADLGKGQSAPATVINYGTIKGVSGAVLKTSGNLINGSAADRTALITGTRYGAYAGHSASVSNFGTIEGDGANYSGALLGNGVILTNGSAIDTTAEITSVHIGVEGASDSKSATVINYGTIVGSGGTAVMFNSAQDVLVAGGAAVFVGAVKGAGGRLELAGGGGAGVGTIFAVAGGVLDVRNAATTNTFSGFGNLEIGARTQFGVRAGGPGGGVVSASVIDDGVLTVSKGTVDFSKAMTGTGTLKVNHGAILQFDGSVAANLSVVLGAAHAVLALREPAQFAATLHGFAAGDTIDLLNTAATSATLGPNDTLVIDNGGQRVATLQLSGSYGGDTFSVVSDGHGGSDISISTGARSPTGPQAHVFLAAMAGLGAAVATGQATFDVHETAWRVMVAQPRAQIA